MSRKKDSKKKNYNSTIKNHQNTGPLFTDVDAKSMEVSDYTMGHGAFQTNGLMQEYLIPSGVGKLYNINNSLCIYFNSWYR